MAIFFNLIDWGILGIFKTFFLKVILDELRKALHFGWAY